MQVQGQGKTSGEGITFKRPKVVREPARPWKNCPDSTWPSPLLRLAPSPAGPTSSPGRVTAADTVPTAPPAPALRSPCQRSPHAVLQVQGCTWRRYTRVLGCHGGSRRPSPANPGYRVSHGGADGPPGPWLLSGLYCPATEGSLPRRPAHPRG